VFVKPPKGYEHLLEEDEVWVLDRLLPGQRAGTKEWSLFVKEVVEKEGYETFQMSPSLYMKKKCEGRCRRSHLGTRGRHPIGCYTNGRPD